MFLPIKVEVKQCTFRVLRVIILLCPPDAKVYFMEQRKILVWYLLFQESFSKEDKNQSGIIDMQSFQVNIL